MTGAVSTRLALLAAALIAALAGPSAGASAKQGDELGRGERVIAGTIEGNAGTAAVVESSPFHIRFLRRGGAQLAELRPRRSLTPRRLPLTEDPEPLTLERRPDRALYAPLSFEVGSEQRAQWNAGFWNGNLLFSRRSGTVHSARRVLSARRRGRGIRFVVSTSDAGRRLVVLVSPDRGRAFRVRVRARPATGVITMGDSFRAARGEGFHGFGGRHGETDKRGQKLYGWASQESFGGRSTLSQTQLLPTLIEQGTDYTADSLAPPARVPQDLPGGFERYLVPTGRNGAYYPQAQFVSSRGYGFMLNQTELSRWRMANDRPDAWQVQASAAKLDYTVVLGRRPADAVRGLTAIGGRHRLPPAWAQGSILSRAVATPPLPGVPAPETAATYRAKVERDLVEIERNDLRPSAYAFEGWALLDDLDYVRDVIRRLRARGIRAVLYHRAYVSDDALNTQPKGDFEETRRLGLVARTADGSPYLFGGNGDSPATLLDFTNPGTVRWWRGRLELSLDLGASGFMQDFGEQVQEGMRFADGSTGKTMHNRYPVLFHRVSRRIVDDYARRKGLNEPIWFFTRSGYSGRPGSAAAEMSNFPGDETTDWSAGSGLRSLAPDMLNRAAGGAFGFSTDIGGYIDFTDGPPDAELFTRWSEWAALTPYFRVHNSAVNGTRMPWSYGRPTLSRWKALAALHRRAVPYMRRLWRVGRRKGMPVTRPLWLAYPRDRRARRQDQQWMLGPDVLVAPVVEEGATSRRVYIPRGCWRLTGAGRRRCGPRFVTVSAPLGSLPYFVRAGAKPF
jgi:alpha-glucosidase (family GH31 glycosyl hydrolase)